MKKIKNPCLGSSFDDFLKEEGIYHDIRISILKEFITNDIKKGMKEKNISQATLAKELGMTKGTIKRLLNDHFSTVTFETLYHVARVLGKELEINFIDPATP